MPRLTLTAALSLILAACSAGADKSAAEAGVERFHRMIDAGRYSEIYATAAPEFRQGGPEEGAVNFLRTVHDRAGPVRRTAEQGWRVNFASGGNVVNLSYQTEFASARGVESFSFRVNGGSARLMGYNINAPALLMAPPPVVAVETNAAAPDAGKPVRR